MTDLDPAPGATAAGPVDGVTDAYRWVALGVVLVGSLMVVIDTTVVNVGLAAIRRELGGGIGVEWVVTAYLLAVAVSQPASGWLADRFGRKQVLTVSLGAFTAASLCAAMAPTLGALIGVRAVQGLAGGAMMPVGLALVFEVFPPERRGQAMGAWGVATMLGPAVGPTIGGWIVSAVSWHWLFLVNVPFGVAGFVLSVRLLRDFGHRDARPFDTLGFGLAGSGLVLLLLGVSESARWGWSSPPTVGSVLGGLALLGAFALHELRTPAPMIEVRIFRVPVFTVGLLVTMFVTAAQFARLVFIPLQLQDLRGTSALQAGLLLSPGAVAAALAMPIGGRLVDRVGSRLPVVTGATLMLVAALALGNLTTTTSLWVIALLLVLQGAGMGIAAVPATVVALNSIPVPLVAQATAARTVSAQAAGALAVGGFAALVAARTGPTEAAAQAAYNSAFLAAALVLVGAVLLGMRLPNAPSRPPPGGSPGPR